MTALEKINEMEKIYVRTIGPKCVKDLFFLLDAFKVMREIAIQVHKGEYVEVPYTIDKEFEERMKNANKDMA